MLFMGYRGELWLAWTLFGLAQAAVLYLATGDGPQSSDKNSSKRSLKPLVCPFMLYTYCDELRSSGR